MDFDLSSAVSKDEQVRRETDQEVNACLGFGKKDKGKTKKLTCSVCEIKDHCTEHKKGEKKEGAECHKKKKDKKHKKDGHESDSSSSSSSDGGKEKKKEKKHKNKH